jgi:hypothetical protein
MSTLSQSTASAQDVSVQSALPIEMNYTLPSSLPSAKNFEIRVQPVNAQSFQSGNTIQWDIPAGRRGQYLDPNTTYVRFKATFTHGGTTATDFSRLLGSAYSFFSKQEVYGNNSVLLESINEPGVLANMLFNCQLNDSDKRGLSATLGFEYNTACFPTTANAAGNTTTAGSVPVNCAFGPSATAGHLINFNTTIASLTFDYAIPLLGILGTGTDKMFPIGAIYGLRFELLVDNFANFTRLYAGTNMVTGCTISDVEFVANIIELSPESQSLIEQANPQKIHIRSQSYRQASNFLSASTGVGTNDLLVGIRLSSLKSIYVCCSPSNALELKFAGVNPNLTQGSAFIIAGTQYPQRGSDPSNKPADSFMELQKSFGALNCSVFNGCMSKNGYYNGSTAYGYMQAYTAGAANTASGYQIMQLPNQFYYGIDTEVVARKANLLSGINVNSSPMFFRANIGAQLSANQHTLYFYGYYDLILEIDVQAKNIIAKF